MTILPPSPMNTSDNVAHIEPTDRNANHGKFMETVFAIADEVRKKTRNNQAAQAFYKPKAD